jgi:hypothetical protein
MNRRERVLYHQIHPAKLLTDVGTAAVAAALLWMHHPVLALVVGFVPSIIVSVVLVDGEISAVSQSVRQNWRFMTRGVELARLAGLIPLWVAPDTATWIASRAPRGYWLLAPGTVSSSSCRRFDERWRVRRNT